MRLIDADAIEYKESKIDITYRSTDGVLVWQEKRKLEWVSKEDIDKMPTIEAEPVIKCKDCHYAKPYNKTGQLPKRDTLLCTHFAYDEVDNNFFCGYAIKKMDEVNNERNG